MPAQKKGEKLFDNCLDFRYLKHINKKSENIYTHTHTHNEYIDNINTQSCLEMPNPLGKDNNNLSSNNKLIIFFAKETHWSNCFSLGSKP